jgi:hypothetical protein
MTSSKHLVISGQSQHSDTPKIQTNTTEDKWSDGCTCLESTRANEPSDESTNQIIRGPGLTNGGTSDQMVSRGGAGLNASQKLQSVDSFPDKTAVAEENSITENVEETNGIDNVTVVGEEDQAGLDQELLILHEVRTGMGARGAKNMVKETGMDERGRRRLDTGAGTGDRTMSRIEQSTSYLYDNTQQRRLGQKMVS